MKTVLQWQWQQWRQQRHRRKVGALLRQRERIERTGWSLSAEVESSYHTGISANGLQLVRLRLRIALLDQQYLKALSYAFVPGCWKDAGEATVRIQFLAGDLSQVIIKP